MLCWRAKRIWIVVPIASTASMNSSRLISCMFWALQMQSRAAVNGESSSFTQRHTVSAVTIVIPYKGVKSSCPWQLLNSPSRKKTESCDKVFHPGEGLMPKDIGFRDMTQILMVKCLCWRCLSFFCLIDPKSDHCSGIVDVRWYKNII